MVGAARLWRMPVSQSRWCYAIVVGLCVLRLPCPDDAVAQDAAAASLPTPHSIVSISVSPGSGAIAAPCPGGTPESVSAPDGSAINCYGGLATLADEHATVFPPGTFPGHSDYLFFVATRTNLNPNESGTVVLTGGAGPNTNGQWTFDFAPDFGLYAPNAAAGWQHGQLFLATMEHDLCPTPANPPDATFDLNYADPGTVFVDPTNRANNGPGSLVMIYEGTNRCIGLNRMKVGGNNFFSSIAVATSLDGGHTWPTYAANFVAPPNTNPSIGPYAPEGALGNGVCIGSDCVTPPPANYGRYSILTPVVYPQEAFALSPGGLTNHVGDSEPSAFVDDVSTSPNQYVYVVHGYAPGQFACDSCSDGNPSISPPYELTSDLTVARAQLNGGTAPLSFTKWYQAGFTQPGRGEDGGGRETPIFAVDSNGYANCLAPDQARAMGSISYVQETQQYLLTFVCASPSDPATTTDPENAANPSPGQQGAAWFYSTMDAIHLDLSHQDRWSRPTEIGGSWAVFANAQNGGPAGGCFRNFDGWYPTFMSLNHKPGHLSTTGYVFYMNGCTDDTTPNGRRFSARTFNIATE